MTSGNNSNKRIRNSPIGDDTSQQPSPMATEVTPNDQEIENNSVNTQSVRQLQYQQVTQETATESLDMSNVNYVHNP